MLFSISKSKIIIPGMLRYSLHLYFHFMNIFQECLNCLFIFWEFSCLFYLPMLPNHQMLLPLMPLFIFISKNDILNQSFIIVSNRVFSIFLIHMDPIVYLLSKLYFLFSSQFLLDVMTPT